MHATTKGLPGGPLSPRTHISHQNRLHVLWKVVTYKFSQQEVLPLRSYLDRCRGWELAKPHQQGMRQITTAASTYRRRPRTVILLALGASA